MEYECGPLLLFSKDKIRMMDFLSDVFEFDVDSIDESIQRGPLSLKLCSNNSSNPPVNQCNIIFSFKVKSENELKEIISKYNFFLYRKSLVANFGESIEFNETENRKILTISDIDQRLWRFELDFRRDI